MNYGRYNLDFATIPGMEKAIAYLVALPKPTKGYRSSYADESATYILADKGLAWSHFPIKGDKWVRLVQKALAHAGIEHKPVESLKSGMYTNDVFVVGDYAIYIAPLRRGGRGLLVCDKQHVKFMRKDDKETRSRSEVKEKVLATLTIEQKRALGL